VKICIIYFSATNNTKTIAELIKENLERMDQTLIIRLIDITPYSNRNEENDFNFCQKFIFGFPVYGWRAPSVVRNWLKKLDGKGRECAMFFTYGGINPGVVHYETHKLLTKKNFKVISSAEFIASHTYNLGGWKVLENRPNKEDFNLVKRYTRKILKIFQKSTSNNLSFKPHKFSDKILEKIEKNPKRFVEPPKRLNDCSLCGKCEEICPINAIDSEKGEADENKCIRCLSCVKNCPEDALKINDLSPLFKMVLQIENLTEDQIRNRKSKIFI